MIQALLSALESAAQCTVALLITEWTGHQGIHNSGRALLIASIFTITFLQKLAAHFKTNKK